MRLHRGFSDARPSRPDLQLSPPKASDPTAAAEVTILRCSGCGKTGVSICARCSKKPGYKTALARAHPLQERDAKLYKRLDEMSRSPLRGNKQLWDEFCIEIKAEDLYEHLPILVEILQEGKWRTDTLYPRKWLRENFARRVKRMSAPEDYGPTGKRLPGGPKIDKRTGALTAFSARPFAEFESEVGGDGDIISAVEVLEGRIARKDLQTSGGSDDMPTFASPPDRNSLQFMGRLTFAERFEAWDCEELADALKGDRPAFDKVLAGAISNQRELVGRIGLDHDEAEVLAVIELLWSVGPRMYLNFLDEPNKKRIRNAWDRLDRKRKRPEWAALLRQALRDFAHKTRATWAWKYWADYDRSMDRQGWKHLVRPDNNYGNIPLDKAERAKWAEAEFPPFPCTCGAADHRFCTCRRGSGPIGGGWANPSGGSMRAGPGNFEGMVRLDCDLHPEEKRVYSAYEKKHNSPKTTIPRRVSSP